MSLWWWQRYRFFFLHLSKKFVQFLDGLIRKSRLLFFLFWVEYGCENGSVVFYLGSRFGLIIVCLLTLLLILKQIKAILVVDVSKTFLNGIDRFNLALCFKFLTDLDQALINYDFLGRSFSALPDPLHISGLKRLQELGPYFPTSKFGDKLVLVHESF